MAPPPHVAVYERDPWSPAWNVWIEGLQGVHTFGSRLAHARSNVREALALFLDVDPSSLEIEDDVRLPTSARETVAGFAQAKQDLEAARLRSASAMTAAARSLLEAGLSMRDSADLLGLSHQRVSQIIRDVKPPRVDRASG
jgi:predicted RNase H-like HicB family nuclease